MRKIIILATLLCIGAVASAQQFTLSNGQAQWQMVVQDDRSTHELMMLSCRIVSNPQILDNAVIGRIDGIELFDSFIPELVIGNWYFSANVCYEFRDGRYRVTVSCITMTKPDAESGSYQQSSLGKTLYNVDEEPRKAMHGNFDYLDQRFSQLFKLEVSDNDW
jgi:hypothetical protein